MLSYIEYLAKDIYTAPDMIDKAVATYHDNYYKLSVVKNGEVSNNLEFWWDAIEDKIDFIYGRKVSYYCHADSTKEEPYSMIARDDAGYICYENQQHSFDGTAITVKLKTKDVKPMKGRNVRFCAFRPDIEPGWDVDFTLRYNLDGRISNPTGSNPVEGVDGQGEYESLGYIWISNQTQFEQRVLPKVNYSKGQSINFEITDSVKDRVLGIIGMGVDFIPKEQKVFKLVGG
jgi:hypothetical protein